MTVHGSCVALAESQPCLRGSPLGIGLDPGLGRKSITTGFEYLTARCRADYCVLSAAYVDNNLAQLPPQPRIWDVEANGEVRRGDGWWIQHVGAVQQWRIHRHGSRVSLACAHARETHSSPRRSGYSNLFPLDGRYR